MTLIVIELASAVVAKAAARVLSSAGEMKTRIFAAVEIFDAPDFLGSLSPEHLSLDIQA